MSRRQLFFVLAFAGGLLAGNLLSGSGVPDPVELLRASPAHAVSGNILVLDQSTFVSTAGSSAYIWSWDGERVVLVGQCSRIDEGSAEQAPFVWLPGVERRS